MALATDFVELRVYRGAFDAASAIFEATRRFPKEERYSLIDQIRRSSRSVCANIAEAWLKRRYPASFVSKLTDAGGETAETQVWLDTALACGYLEATTHATLRERYAHIGAQIGRMIAEADRWCGVGEYDTSARTNPRTDKRTNAQPHDKERPR